MILGARRIAVPYLLAGTAWILLTDWLLADSLPTTLVTAQTIKGLAFVIVTTGIIYVLADRELRQRREGAEERLQLERRLAATERFEAVGQLASGIAHDFNNLLTAISGNIESYLARPASGAPAAELEEARRSADRGAELTRQLLAVGRTQAMSPTRVAVNDVVRGMAGLLHGLMGARIRVDTVLAEGLWPVMVDTGRLEQAVLNLAINARDAMPDGGVLTLRTANHTISDAEAATFPFPFLPGAYVRLDVGDTGVGIPADLQPRIFEPFFTTKPKDVGTGLGLATVYGVVKQSGGYITVESEPGEGSTFAIFLPVAAHAGGEGDTVTAAFTQDSAYGTETVLVAEDDDAVRSFAARALRGRGFDVLEALDAEEALLLLTESGYQIDMLVTDSAMPGMNGTQLIAAARAAGFRAPALLISGTPEQDVHGTVPFLAKPFTADDLARRVRALLGQPSGRV